MKQITLIIIILTFSTLMADSLSGIDPSYYDYDARFIAMGGSGVALTGYSPSVTLINPANLAEMERNLSFQAVNSSYFGLVSYNYLGAAYARNKAVYGVGIDFSGDDLLMEYEFILSAALSGKDWFKNSRVFNKLDFGLNLRLPGADFGNNADGEYIDANGMNHQVSGNAFGYALDLGLQYEINENNAVGISNRNLVNDIFWESSNECNTALGSYDESRPVALTIGYCYNNPRTNICLDYKPKLYEDSENYLKAGFEFGFFKNVLHLRSGWNTQIFSLENNQFNVGFGINIDYAGHDFKLDAAYRMFTNWEGHNNLLISLTAGI